MDQYLVFINVIGIWPIIVLSNVAQYSLWQFQFQFQGTYLKQNLGCEIGFQLEPPYWLSSRIRCDIDPLVVDMAFKWDLIGVSKWANPKSNQGFKKPNFRSTLGYRFLFHILYLCVCVLCVCSAQKFHSFHYSYLHSCVVMIICHLSSHNYFVGVPYFFVCKYVVH